MSGSSGRQRGSQALGPSRAFRLLHQNLIISDVNFRRRTIIGSTELRIVPLAKLTRVHLNCKQCRILRITINSSTSANYTYTDPTLSVCPSDSKKRNLEYFDSRHYECVIGCDTDLAPGGGGGGGGGELVVKVPRDMCDMGGRSEGRPMEILIEFSLEQPKGGVQFVVPSSDALVTHVFSYGSSSRLWFPCVDSYSQPCHWTLSFTVPLNMTAVSCGDLTEQLLSVDGKKKTFQYSLSVPTAAPCIGFAIGSFTVYPDPVMHEMTHFCLPGLLPALKHTVQFVHETFGFYEELLGSRFPHSSYKLVFVDKAYQDQCSFSSLGIFNTNLLHPPQVLDQVPATRKVIAHAIAQQYFGCYMLPHSWSDWWLTVGIAQFIAGLFTRKCFGNTEYQYWITQEQRKVCKYEAEHTLPPLCEKALDEAATPTSPRHLFHPHLTLWREEVVMRCKAHLVLRMILLRVGHDLLLQVFNKLLTLASTTGSLTTGTLTSGSVTTGTSSKDHTSRTANLLLSTSGFMKLILTVSGKDLSHFFRQWVARSGVPRFHGSFAYLRKKNILELKLLQDPPSRGGGSKFVGPMTVTVQEFDGCFSHSIQIEDSTTTYELPCHSKIRKSKKRKVPLCHGEEVEVDISNLDSEMPVLWVRVDPECQWLMSMFMEQADIVWQCMLRYERDACAQLQAIEALQEFPSSLSLDLLKETVYDSNFFYQVRIQAAKSLAKLVSGLAGGSVTLLIGVFQKLFGTAAYPSIVRYNDFSDFASYLLQKALPLCIATVRNTHGQCPREVASFITDLLNYSDNIFNKFSDGHYVGSLLEALAASIAPKVTVGTESVQNGGSSQPLLSLSHDMQEILQEAVQFLNTEKLLPSYHYTITVSCLRVVHALQKNGHLPLDTSIFKEYTGSNHFVLVREAALSAIVDTVQVGQREEDLSFLLDVVENDDPAVRLSVLGMMVRSPPFTRRSESTLNCTQLVERLWELMCSKLSHDTRLRNAVVDLWSALYGRLTPTCMPQGLGLVIDLKEKVARSSMASPTTTPAVQDLNIATHTYRQSSSIPAVLPHPTPVAPATPTCLSLAPPSSTPSPSSLPSLTLTPKPTLPSFTLKRSASKSPSWEATPTGSMGAGPEEGEPRPSKKHKADRRHKKHKHKSKQKHSTQGLSPHS